MADVATSVGIRAPSLYGHFKDRASLIAAIELQIIVELGERLEAKISSADPRATLKSQAREIRQFAKANPNGYSMIFDARAAKSEENTTMRAATLGRLLPALGSIAGEDHALDAARILVPFLHGLISIELTDGFRLGGRTMDDAFETGTDFILRGLPNLITLDPEA